MMNKTKFYILSTLRFLLALFMINGGVQHFLKPAFYIPFVPPFLPFTETIILLSGIVEVALGIMLFFPRKTGKYAALAIFLMMLLFLPIHTADLFLDKPAIGTHTAAWIRFFVQFVFIAWTWIVYNFIKRGNNDRR